MEYRKKIFWIKVSLTILAAILVLAGLVWGNYRYAKNNPGGNDFLVHWLGNRLFITEGQSPYSDETALAIQKMVYGRAARTGEHELRVAYPLYSLLLFAPFSLISDYVLARAVWMTVLEISLVLISYLSIRLTNWKPGIGILAVFLIFSIFWYHALRPLINGNAVILITLFVVGAIYCIRHKQDELAGVLLAFSTIKPQVVLLIVLYIIYWAIRKKRWQLVIWFFTSITILVAFSFLLMPNWLLQNLIEVVRYPGYNPAGTLGEALTEMLPGIGERLGWVVSGLLALILIMEWQISLKTKMKGFVWTVCLTLVASQWIGIQTDPGNFIVLVPVLVYLFSVWQERWKKNGNIFILVTMIILFIGLWWLFTVSLIPGAQPQQGPIMFLPLPGILLPLLYWVRWWAINSPSTWYDEVSSENDMLYL